MRNYRRIDNIICVTAIYYFYDVVPVFYQKGIAIMISISDVVADTYRRDAEFEKICVIVLKHVHYVVSPIGEISISIDVDNQEYSRFRYTKRKHSNAYKLSWTDDINVDTDVLQTGDKFVVYHNKTTDVEFWQLLSRVDPPNASVVAIRCQPTHCPVCGEPLRVIDTLVGCINAQCSARVMTTIKRYMVFATDVLWEPIEFKIVALLIENGTIKDASDLYILTEEDIFDVGFTEEVTTSFLSKISSTVGMVSLSKYLRSLNIMYPDRLVLYDQCLDAEFTAPEFLEWICKLRSTELASGKMSWVRDQISLYMSISAYDTVQTYFDYGYNVETFTALCNYGVFVGTVRMYYSES